MDGRTDRQTDGGVDGKMDERMKGGCRCLTDVNVVPVIHRIRMASSHFNHVLQWLAMLITPRVSGRVRVRVKVSIRVRVKVSIRVRVKVRIRVRVIFG